MGTPALKIAADSFNLFFHSDGSNNDWGWKLTVVAEMPTAEANANEASAVLLNDKPLYIGQIPFYAAAEDVRATAAAMNGLLANMCVFKRALSAPQVELLTRGAPSFPSADANGDVSGGTDEGQNLGVLALLERGVSNIDRSVHDSVSKALAGVETLAALLALFKHGSALLQVTSDSDIPQRS
jgi:hypothetical protein